MIIKISMPSNYLDIFIISMRKYKDGTIIIEWKIGRCRIGK